MVENITYSHIFIVNFGLIISQNENKTILFWKKKHNYQFKTKIINKN